jgi:hypothetical protein
MKIITYIDNCYECHYNSYSIVGNGICILAVLVDSNTPCFKYEIPKNGIAKWCPFKNKNFNIKSYKKQLNRG